MPDAEQPVLRDHAWARSLFGLTDYPPATPSHQWSGLDQEHEGTRVRGLILHGSASAEIPALLIQPLDGGDGPRVLAIHQHNNEYELGKSEVAGLRGDPEMAYGLELAQHGCTVLAADVHGFEDRAPAGDPRIAEQTHAWNLIANGSSLGAFHVRDLRDLVSWLAEQPSTTAPMGVIGHSLGGTIALFLAATDERVTATVSSCGIGTLESFAAQEGLLHNPSWYVPGLREQGDASALASVLDTQQMYVVSAGNDHLFPLAGIHAVVAGFRPGRAVADIYPAGHSFPEPIRSRALDWLMATLRP